MKLFKTHTEMANAISAARAAALVEAKQKIEAKGGWYQSRGAWTLTVGKEGRCSPRDESVANTEWETKKGLDALIALVLEKHPAVSEIYVEGGYDYAASLIAYEGGEYDPWVSEWSVKVWERDGVVAPAPVVKAPVKTAPVAPVTPTPHNPIVVAPNTKLIEAFVNKHSDLLGMLYGRWQDESEYEDINEYGARIANEFPEGWNLVKTTKRPFGVVIQIGVEQHQITVAATSIKWKRLKDAAPITPAPTAPVAATKKIGMHNHNGVLVGTYDNLNAAWLSVKSEEGPLSKEPQTLKEFNDALAYADCYAKEV